MTRGTVLGILALSLAAGCALLPASAEEGGSRPDDRGEFAEVVRQQIQDNEWQAILSASDPGYYQSEVVAGGTPEVRYLASLLGLMEPDNRIQEGDELDWSDLDRIVAATLAPVNDEGPPYRYTGLATLESREQLRLNAWITRVQGRFVLTAPPQPSR